MEMIGSRMLKSLYRKEPVVSFMVTIGAVDATIGGLNEYWSLMTLGLGTAGIAIVLRVWQLQRRQPMQEPHHAPVHILPPHSSPSLPPLSLSKKTPPGRF